MKIKLSNIKFHNLDVIIYIIIGIFFLINLLLLDYTDSNLWVILTFYSLGIFYFYCIVRNQQAVTLYKVYYIFNFIFMFFAPLQQYLNGTVFQLQNGWKLIYTDNDYFCANVSLIIFSVCFELAHSFFYKKNKHGSRRKQYYFVTTQSDFTTLFLILMSVFVMGILFVTGNIVGKASVSFESSNQNIISQIINILRFFPVACFLISVLQKSQNYKIYRFAVLIYAAEIIIIFFPLNGTISRYLLFGTYLSLFSLFFSKSRFKSMLFLGYVIGFYFIFPAFNYFKTHESGDLSGFSFILVDFDFVDYDAYQLFMASMGYVKRSGTFLGMNFLTAALCFIPRSIWHGKMAPSGEIIARFFGSSFTNLSCPFVAECFLGFGWFGILLGGLFLGWIFKIIDKFNDSNSYFLKGVFCILSGLMIYILRGALLPTVSYTISLVISLAMVCGINRYFSFIYFANPAVKMKLSLYR